MKNASAGRALPAISNVARASADDRFAFGDEHKAGIARPTIKGSP